MTGPQRKNPAATASADPALSLTSAEVGTQTSATYESVRQANPDTQREAAIARASMFRDGRRTIDSGGRELTHDSISIAKRHSRTVGGLGRCVAQRRGEDLFRVMRDRIAAEEARKAAEEAAEQTQ